MTWFADLSPCTEFDFLSDVQLRAVGWLDREHPYTTGPVDRSTYDRLQQLFRDPWQPVVAMGGHECNLCVFDGEARGSANLIVPRCDVLYMAPKLILHYMNAHGYRPPEEFCNAVAACPDTRSMDYKRMLLASGGRALVAGH
jgi:hypothetical protein